MQTIVELFRINQAEELDEMRPLVIIAKNILRRIQASPKREPKLSSAALNAFDPRVTRRLHTVVPIRVLDLPSQQQVWKSVEDLLDGWESISHLHDVHSLGSWKVHRSLRNACIFSADVLQVAGMLNAWGSGVKLKHPYIRSLTQVPVLRLCRQRIAKRNLSRVYFATVT